MILFSLVICIALTYAVDPEEANGSNLARSDHPWFPNYEKTYQALQEVSTRRNNLEIEPFVGEGEFRRNKCNLGLLIPDKILITTSNSVISTALIVPADTSSVLEIDSISEDVFDHDDGAMDCEDPPSPLFNREVAVKFSNDCKGRMENKPLVDLVQWEYDVLSVLNSTGLTPKVYYISQPVNLPSDKSTMPAQAQSSWLAANFELCQDAQTEIRFIVEERVGPTVSSYLNWVQKNLPDFYASPEYSRWLIILYRKALELLEGIHQLGFVHGDFHGANIAFAKPVDDWREINPEEDKLVLLDFELSDFFPGEFGQPVKHDPVLIDGLTAFLLSPWQLLAERKGPRDDIYRATLLFGNLLSRHQYVNGFKRLMSANLRSRNIQDRSDPMYRKTELDVAKYIKLNSPIFTYSFMLASFSQIGTPKSHEIAHLLENIHEHLKYCDHPEVTVDFNVIYHHIDKALALF